MADDAAVANPYLGPRPFEPTAEDRRRFFGRERETMEIVSWVAGHQVVLVYAQSGAGKTSLFNASVSPALEAMGYQVLPPLRVTGAAPDGALDANPYVASACTGLGSIDRSGGRDLRDALAVLPRATDRRGSPQPRVVVLDQFEELFSDRREAAEGYREEFFDQIAAAADADDLLRLVFVMREDHIAELDPYAPRVPERFKVRFRLERLGVDAAEDAIVRPLDGTGRAYSPEAVEYLVRELTAVRSAREGRLVEGHGRYVEPVQLQVVCYGLWGELPPSVTVIGTEDVARLGDVTQRLGEYYEEAVHAVAAEEGIDAGALRRWIGEELITAAGTRGAVAKGNGLTGRTRGIPTDGVEALVDRHVVRREDRAGLIWYELTHDRFVEPILERNAAWERLRRDALESPLAAPAQAWLEYDRDPAALLRGRQLQRAQVWANLYPDDLSSEERSFLAASEDEAHRRRAAELRRNRVEKWLALGALAVAVGLLAWAVSATSRANTEASIAAANGLAATSQALVNSGERLDVPLLLAVAAAAAREPPTVQARASLYSALEAASQLSPFRYPGGSVTALDAAGGLIATATVQDVDGEFVSVGEVWAEDGGGPLVARAMLDLDLTTAVAVDPTGTWVAFPTDAAGSIAVVNVDLERRFDLPAVAADDPLGGHTDEVTGLDFDPAGPAGGDTPGRLASASADGSVIVWGLRERIPVQSFRGLAGDSRFTDVAFDGDGTLLAAASSDGMVVVWDVAVPTEVDRGPIGSGPTEDGVDAVVAWGPGGELAAATNVGQVMLWPAPTGGLGSPTELRAAGPGVNGVEFLPDGSALALALADGSVVLLPTTPAVVEETLRGLHFAGQAVTGLAVAANPTVVHSGGLDGSFVTWLRDDDGFGARREQAPRCDDGTAPVLGWRDGTLYGAGCEGGYRWTDDAPPVVVPAIPAGLAAGFSPEGEIVAVATATGVVVADVATGTSEPIAGSAGATHVAVANDGTVAWTTVDGRIGWREADGTPRDQPGDGEAFTSVAISPNGRWVAAGDEAGTTFVWDAASGDPPRRYASDVRVPVNDLAFTPDGRRVVTAGPAGTVQGIPVDDADVVELIGHRAEVVAVALSGKRHELLASGGADGEIILWDAATGVRLAALAGSDEAIATLAFNSAGELAAGTEAGSVLVWDLSLESIKDLACQKANRNLTATEWQRYTGRKSGYDAELCPEQPVGR